MGVDLILLTGNPGMGVNNEAIEATLKLYREELGDRVILAAGKMHAAGVLTEAAEQIMTKEDVRRFREAGADVLLFRRREQCLALRWSMCVSWWDLPTAWVR